MFKKTFERLKKIRNFICETECHDIIVASSFAFILCGITCMLLTWWIKGAADIAALLARTDTVIRIIQVITSINLIIFNGVRLLKLNYDRTRNTPVIEDINGNLQAPQIQLPSDELNNRPTNRLTTSYNIRINNSGSINAQQEEQQEAQHDQNNNIFSKIRSLCYRCG